MADLFPARSPLAAIETVEVADPGVVFTERRPLRALHVAGLRAGDGAKTAARAFGLAELPAPNRSAGGDARRMLWIAPQTWLLVGSDVMAATLPFMVVADVSGAWAAIRANGPSVRRVLATTCTLDLHSAVFQVGHCAQTRMAQVGVLLDRPAGTDTFDLYVARSYAVALLEWLAEAAAYHGCAVRSAQQP